jgi:hypothetical protein
MNFEKLQNKIKLQLNQLYNVLQSLNIKQEITTLRMHYLNKDFTLGYADHAGLGVVLVKGYVGYHVLNKKILDIKIEPLIVMDCILFDYIKLNCEQAYNVTIGVKRKCQKMNVQFNISRYNSYVQNPRRKKFYQNLIQN